MARFRELIPILFACLAGTSCGEDGADPAVPIAEETFECTDGRDGWEQCVDGSILWCHVLPGTAPHFHSGAPCARLGFECVEHGDRRASCVDPESSCSAGESRCENNDALTCLDGRWAIQPCGTSRACHVHEGRAECEERTSSGDFPALACATFEDSTHAETKEVALRLEDVFSHAYHAERGHPTTVTLPEAGMSYIHFPVEEDGEYVVFLSEPGALDEIMDREGAVMTKAGGAPNGRCSAVIRDHYHAHLHYDPPQGHAGPVPYVLRFASGSARTVTFLVLRRP